MDLSLAVPVEPPALSRRGRLARSHRDQRSHRLELGGLEGGRAGVVRRFGVAGREATAAVPTDPGLREFAAHGRPAVVGDAAAGLAIEVTAGEVDVAVTGHGS